MPRPDFPPVDEDEEWRRLALVLPAVRRAVKHTPITVDTSKASVVRRAVEAGIWSIAHDSGMTDELQYRYQFWNHLKYQVICWREYLAISYYKVRGWI